MLGRFFLTCFVAVAAVTVAVVSRTSDRWNLAMPTCQPSSGEVCHVLVTGASRGIGRATSLALGRAGFTVWAAVRSEAAAAQFDSEENVTAVLLDVANTTQMELLVQRLPSPLYGVVNNAGVGGDTVFELDTTFERLMQINLLAPTRLTRLVLPAMRKRGRGRIVNIGSVNGEIATPLAVGYATAKAGLRVWGDSLRREVMHLGVHVSTIEPGFTEGTDMAFEVEPRLKEHREALASNKDLADYAPFYTEAKIKEFNQLFYATLMPIKEVTDDILHALSSTRPHGVYLESHFKWVIALLNVVPTFLIDRALAVMT